MAKAAQKTVAKPAVAKKPEPSKAVARATTPKSVATTGGGDQLPDFMKGYEGQGAEAIGREDLEIPRLKLIQNTAPELELYNDLRPGNFFHTTSEVIFDEALRVIPIFIDKRYILWNPLDSGGGILARADDGIHWSPANQEFSVTLDKKFGGKQVKWRTAKTVKESGLANWGTMDPQDPNSQPAATQMLNVLFAFPDYPDVMPAAFSFQRASIKQGRGFITKLKTNRAPTYGTIWTLTSASAQNATNQSYKIPQLVAAGLVTDPVLFQQCLDSYKLVSERGLNLKDIEALQDDDTDDQPEQVGGQQQGSSAGSGRRPSY